MKLDPSPKPLKSINDAADFERSQTSDVIFVFVAYYLMFVTSAQDIA